MAEYLETSETAFKKGEEELAASLQHTRLNIEGIDLKEEDITSSTAITVLGKLVFYRHDLIGRMRYGFVIQLYGAFEVESVALIRVIIKRHPEQALTLSNKPDFPKIKAALLHLGATAAILEEIDQLRELRNSLAHSNGSFALSKDTQQNVITSLSTADAGVTVGEDGFVEIERRYCEKALNTITSLFNEIIPKYKFGQAYFFSKTHGYGIKTSPSENGPKYEFVEREELAKIQASPEFQDMLKREVVGSDPGLETDPSSEPNH